MITSCSGIILAGGLNTRFSGREKAFITVGGERIIDRIYRIFRDTFEDVLVVTNDPLKYLGWDAHIVTDIFPVRSSLTGIHAGLFHSRTPHAFFAACDTPYLRKEVVQAIVGAITPDIDAVIPKTAAGLEPLCAAYSTRCLDTIWQHLTKDRLKIQRILRKMRVRTVPEERLRRIDPQLTSFFNINSPADLLRAEARQGETPAPDRS
ncbi:MAG: molybdenum cofactor guanylyltransferase [Desulfobacterales bacterium]